MAGAITIIRFLTSDLPTSVRAFRNGWKVAYNFSPLSLADDFRKGFIFCSCSIFPRRFPPIEASALGCIALSFERRLVDWVSTRSIEVGLVFLARKKSLGHVTSCVESTHSFGLFSVPSDPNVFSISSGLELSHL